MLASALTLAAAFIPQEPSPGIDRELARARAATVKDVEYDLRFALGDRLDAVYDVTVEYATHPAVAAAPDPRPNEVQCLLRGLWPPAVAFHVQRVSPEALRAAGPGDWLEKAFAAKEARLAAGLAVERPAAVARPGAHELQRRL